MNNPKSAFTLIEVVIVSALVLLFSLVAFETTEIVNQRDKEDRLKSCLLEMRAALDDFHVDNHADGSHTEKFRYPDTLDELVNTATPKGGFYLRRIPINPMFSAVKWEVSDKTSLAGTTDVWQDLSAYTGGPIVDVRCPPSAGIGLNGIPYKDW